MPASAALRASAPTRLDFGGGWTDVPPYPQERGGFVCNVAIERRATVTLRTRPEPAATEAANAPIIRAALTAAGVPQLDVSLHNDFPVGAGLGGSSAAGVAMAAALATWHNEQVTPAQLAERSRALEVDHLGIAGGRQDHYASAFGGALGLAFDDQVTVTPIALSASTRDALETRCLVYFTGESRISGDTINAVLDAYRNGASNVVLALDRMATLARLMATSLAVGDLDALGALVGEHWVHQRSLHPGIPTERIDTLISQSLAAGALGAKPLGASGGGCVLVIVPAGREAPVHAAIGALAERLPFRVASRGVVVERLLD